MMFVLEGRCLYSSRMAHVFLLLFSTALPSGNAAQFGPPYFFSSPKVASPSPSPIPQTPAAPSPRVPVVPPLIPPDGSGRAPEPFLPPEAFPFEVRCPNGWLASGPHCLAVIAVPGYTQCPDHSKRFWAGLKTSMTVAALSPGVCEETEYRGAEVTCPKGYRVKGKGGGPVINRRGDEEEVGAGVRELSKGEDVLGDQEGVEQKTAVENKAGVKKRAPVVHPMVKNMRANTAKLAQPMAPGRATAKWLTDLPVERKDRKEKMEESNVSQSATQNEEETKPIGMVVGIAEEPPREQPSAYFRQLQVRRNRAAGNIQRMPAAAAEGGGRGRMRRRASIVGGEGRMRRGGATGRVGVRSGRTGQAGGLQSLMGRRLGLLRGRRGMRREEESPKSSDPAFACVATDFIPSTTANSVDPTICPVGYHQSQSGCTAAPILPSTASCSAGFTVASTPIENAFRDKKDLTCKRTKYFRARLVCPSGFYGFSMPFPDEPFGAPISQEALLKEVTKRVAEEKDLLGTARRKSRKLAVEREEEANNGQGEEEGEEHEEGEEVVGVGLSLSCSRKDENGQCEEEEDEGKGESAAIDAQRHKIVVGNAEVYEGRLEEWGGNTPTAKWVAQSDAATTQLAVNIQNEEAVKTSVTESAVGEIDRGGRPATAGIGVRSVGASSSASGNSSDSSSTSSSSVRVQRRRLQEVGLLPPTAGCVQVVAVLASHCSAYSCRTPHMRKLEKTLSNWIYYRLKGDPDAVRTIIPNGHDLTGN
eukprot:GHVS01053077.1.p1 GENE.GHVS01053077.1~~GHVS01053077.1.p1  ORF type:complete len:759 (-),score=134.89 GHVS01053077.1:247-2523(-)